MTLSPGASRVLAVLLLLAVVAGAARFAALPAWQSWQAGRETIATDRDHIERFRRIAASLEPLRDQVAALERQDALKGLMLTEPSPTLAAAALQERVKTVVEQHGGALTSAQVLEPKEAGRFTRVSVAVRMIAEIGTTQRVLHTLESGAPIIVIDDLAILARGGGRVRRGEPSGVDQLDVRFTLNGFMRQARGGG